MRWKELAFLGGAAGAATLVYGALVESKNLELIERTLPLPGWPCDLDGIRIAVLGDFHLRDRWSLELSKRAVAMAIEAEPDFFALVGDFVGYWKGESPWLLGETFEPLAKYAGRTLAIPGNHDYWAGDASLLRPIFSEFGVRLLRNETIQLGDIQWIGIDSLNAGVADPFVPMMRARPDEPTIVLWHEPDAVRFLPGRAHLMLSGHSHGGQFVFPWGWAPIHTRNGERYVQGFHPEPPTPVYVTRGIGTTGPPSRFNCRPEVSVLTLVRA